MAKNTVNQCVHIIPCHCTLHVWKSANSSPFLPFYGLTNSCEAGLLTHFRPSLSFTPFLRLQYCVLTFSGINFHGPKNSMHLSLVPPQLVTIILVPNLIPQCQIEATQVKTQFHRDCKTFSILNSTQTRSNFSALDWKFSRWAPLSIPCSPEAISRSLGSITTLYNLFGSPI